MEKKTYKKCLDIALSYKDKYGITVSLDVFKSVMVLTLHKLSRIRKQIERYTDVNTYIPLLFNDCLYEHYMFSLFEKLEGADRNKRTVI